MSNSRSQFGGLTTPPDLVTSTAWQCPRSVLLLHICLDFIIIRSELPDSLAPPPHFHPRLTDHLSLPQCRYQVAFGNLALLLLNKTVLRRSWIKLLTILTIPSSTVSDFQLPHTKVMNLRRATAGIFQVCLLLPKTPTCNVISWRSSSVPAIGIENLILFTICASFLCN